MESFGRRLLRWSGFGQQESVLGSLALLERISLPLSFVHCIPSFLGSLALVEKSVPQEFTTKNSNFAYVFKGAFQVFLLCCLFLSEIVWYLGSRNRMTNFYGELLSSPP